MNDEKKPPLAKEPEKLRPPKGDKEAEFGGPQGLEPTRYGDWERKGRVSDF